MLNDPLVTYYVNTQKSNSALVPMSAVGESSSPQIMDMLAKLERQNDFAVPNCSKRAATSNGGEECNGAGRVLEPFGRIAENRVHASQNEIPFTLINLTKKQVILC